MWLREPLETLGHLRTTTTLRCENQVAIALTKKPLSHPRTKHIAIRHHQILEWAEQGMIRLESWIRSPRRPISSLSRYLDRHTWPVYKE
jgi:hypothetical protein